MRKANINIKAMNLYQTYLKLRPKQHNTTQHNTTQHNTTSCEVIPALNPKTNLLFLLVSLFSFISCFFSTSAKKQSYLFSFILQSYSEIENNNNININKIYSSAFNNILNLLAVFKKKIFIESCFFDFRNTISKVIIVYN